MSVTQPPWTAPQRQTEEPALKIYNSLTHTKTAFVPRDARVVKWYNCGPTVYDVSHMGHARNYVTQDILRRIMTDYFGYDVHFAMNITDIDDKIIAQSRKNYLFENFQSEISWAPIEVLVEIQTAWERYVRKHLAAGLPEEEKPPEGQEETTWKAISEKVKDENWKTECLKRDEKFDMHFRASSRTYSALQLTADLIQSKSATEADARKLVHESQDILKDFLDSHYAHTVTDPAISLAHATIYENLFFKDMASLRVRKPDILTRVTEFIPEIISFVERVVSKGLAYELEGSVYFDTDAFQAKGGFYGKLEPWSKGNKALLQEGEGALIAGHGRRSPADFALWKARQPGQPFWPSPWGPGRPGWHIECSVMASAVFGDNMDIHSGGIDLAFPHHDNELAQAEAYHGCNAWVNYFMHTGHLHIEGLKMSKSLKNFISIEEILKKYTARQIRLVFLCQLWNAKVDFSESLMTGEMKVIEASINNFFTTVKAIIDRRSSKQSDGRHHYDGDEAELTARIYDAQTAFRAALCDSFNTPEAFNVLRDLISRVNIYINNKGKDANVDVVEHAARWVGKMLRMFGLGEGESEDIGWGQEHADDQNINREEVVMPYLRVLSSFRDGVRKFAIEKNEGALKEILILCDRLRDSDLIPLGVALDDQEDGQALVKLVSPADLIKAREEKQAQAEAKAAKKAATVEAERQKRLQKMEKGKVTPEEMFKPPHVSEGVYSSWSDTGLPMTDGDGKELSKNQLKKAQKDWLAQKRLHEEFLLWSRDQSGSQ